jgi:hypothetical protein
MNIKILVGVKAIHGFMIRLQIIKVNNLQNFTIMNTNKFLSRLLFTISIVLFIGTLATSPISLLAVAGGGNVVTCYSTFEMSGQPDGDKWEVYDCGACTKKNCKSYSNSSTCTYNASTGGGGGNSSN